MARTDGGEDDGDQRRLALLVDGDNAQPKMAERIMSEVSRFGNPVVRRIYGDWASGRLSGWNKALHELAFEASQQHAVVAGKNATDSRLIIDAMDLLHNSPWIEGFCVVSSDSDYTALAKRLRSGGKWVLGIGERKTPRPFVVACDQFSYTDLLGEPATDGPGTPRSTPKKGTTAKPDQELPRLLKDAVEAVAGEDDYANLSQVAQWLRQNKPGFDPREHGRATFSGLYRLYPAQFRFKKAGDGLDYKWVRLSD